MSLTKIAGVASDTEDLNDMATHLRVTTSGYVKFTAPGDVVQERWFDPGLWMVRVKRLWVTTDTSPAATVEPWV